MNGRIRSPSNPVLKLGYELDERTFETQRRQRVSQRNAKEGFLSDLCGKLCEALRFGLDLRSGILSFDTDSIAPGFVTGY
jgi:hypothetical protein